MIKILLIQDEVKAVVALIKGLKDYHIIVDYALDGRIGYEMALNNKYDVILSDVIMPQMNGLEIVKQLRTAGNTTPIMLLTAMGSTEDKVIGFDKGADDYLVKPYEFRELLARIQALARRGKEVLMLNNVLRFADIEINMDTKVFMRSGKIIDLTRKEMALIEYFIRNQGRVISKSEIADKVWGIDFETNTNIIEVYVNYIRNKMDKPYDKKLIHTVFGMGYVLKEEG
jgi:two-component system, OmpR family, copper resistance phosphate regulon response regulator CusR